MRIHTDKNGVYVNAISTLANGDSVEGHLYQVITGAKVTDLSFQQGGVKDHGVNGLTSEALLEVLIHRTRYLDAQFPCNENRRAIVAMAQALHAFESRTASRTERGVEGREVA